MAHGLTVCHHGTLRYGYVTFHGLHAHKHAHTHLCIHRLTNCLNCLLKICFFNSTSHFNTHKQKQLARRSSYNGDNSLKVHTFLHVVLGYMADLTRLLECDTEDHIL